MSETTNNLNGDDNLIQIFNELEQDVETVIEVNTVDVELPKKKKSTFWRNLKYCYYRPWQQTTMASRFQKLAGITPPAAAILTLPNDVNVELQRLPSWYDVIRYQVIGFKLKIYALEDK